MSSTIILPGAVRTRVAAVLALLAAGGCLPYSVNSTAQTVPEGEIVTSLIGGFVLGDSSSPAQESGTWRSNLPIADLEMRLGLSPQSDLGIRVPSGSGLVLNYKRRHWGSPDPDAPAVATVIGGGVVNFASHAYVEASLLVSGARRSSMIPYAALKGFHVLPLSSAALRDHPSVGAALGLRIGTWDRAFVPELAVYYDESVTGLRAGRWVVVPSVGVSGFRLPMPGPSWPPR